MEVINRTITSMLEKEYKDYSMYVCENRALPSLVDGLKTGARKILHSAFKGSLKNGDMRKVPNLAGETMNYALYPHGDASLHGTIVTLSQSHKFNLNPLYIDSQNGTLRTDIASSPRYLYVQLSKYAKLWKTDIELVDYIYDEGQYIEPRFFLPIIPTVLTARQVGLAVGYKYQSMSYSPLDIIDACIKCLESKQRENSLSGFVIHPYINGIRKKTWKMEDGKWINYGECSYDEKKQIINITDLPYDMDFESFEKMLNKMIEREEIKDWENYSEGEDHLDYRIICKKSKILEILKGKDINKKIIQRFKLRSVVPDDLLYVLDENKKILHFHSPHELIEYFVDFRLNKYNDRKDRLVKIINEKLQKNNELIKFIELVCKGKLKIRNRSKEDIKNDMDSYSLSMELIKTAMSKVTIEERDELLKENESIKKELDYIKNTTINQMYINDLKDLRKEIERDFK
jgi:DNA topoisomerase-2